MSDYINQYATFSSFRESAISSFVILSDIERRIKEKIERVGTPLKDWDINIYRGILTGYNEAFIIDGRTKDELIEKSPKNAEIIRPILRGRDIKRYECEFSDLWVILAKYGSHEYLEKDYPFIYEHLMQHKENLQKRGQCRYTRSKKEAEEAPYTGQHHWLELDNNPSQEFLNTFESDKIIYPEITKFLNFYYDQQSYYTNNKCFILSGENIAFLTSFFNSSLFKFCFRDNFPELLGGSRELRKIFMEKLPVIQIDSKKNQLFFSKTIEIQANRAIGINTRNLEIEVDNLIFDLYRLTNEERKIIGFIEIL